jgi:hypothetical protein
LLIDLIKIYECNESEEIDEKTFTLPYIEQLKNDFETINIMESFMIKQRLQNTMTFIQNINKNNEKNKNKIYRVKYMFNDNSENKKNSDNTNENKTISINNNKDLRQCYEKIKECFFYYFDKIYNLENNNNQNILLISAEDKQIMIFDIIKIFSLII